ncbi:MAG: rRNA (guanine966-N2)-methyltransferase [Frankiaceae bacterium]|jgi:16S rRNA (guanine966-N2)-methyltransferase|nr:rRNA (guanine966-N2)-methyltransferase [Frankiaceae bacterium]MDQ1725277.1 rRNA (guanine966-N2)-methyltransferase [Frankiaceae bacterium]
MTRIVAGAARGRRLTVPEGDSTRPTSDRAREGLFGTLESLHGHLYGSRVLDLFSGTGAVGLEALSRGAEAVTLVESGDKALPSVRANIEAVALPGAELVVGPVETFLKAGPGLRAPYDIVFADPPYALDEPDLVGVLETLIAGGWLAPTATVAVERSSKSPAPQWPAGLRGVRDRRYGDAVIHYASTGGSETPA